jgi:putative restriction endonuclease
MRPLDLAAEEMLLEKIRNLRRARGQREADGLSAPHKPLLLLLLLGEIERKGENRFDYETLQRRWNELWPKFGWNTKSGRSKVDYPYRYLMAEGFWRLFGNEGPIPAKELEEPSSSRLRAQAPFGRFTEPEWELLQNPHFRHRLEEVLLNEYFPDYQREDLAASVGLAVGEELETVGVLRETVLVTRRDSAEQARFRIQVLEAYEERCAVCGFAPKGNRSPSPIDAAHIWPVTHEGPSAIQNGLALCRIHHWALDSGSLAIAEDRRVLVSSRVSDGESLERFLRSYAGAPIREPLRTFPAPSERWIRQHRELIFLGPAIAARG